VAVELAGHLLGRPSLPRRAADLKDRRCKRMRYFPEPRSSFEKVLAEERTPPVARAWGFLMKVSEDSFRSTLSKHIALARYEKALVLWREVWDHRGEAETLNDTGNRLLLA